MSKALLLTDYRRFFYSNIRTQRTPCTVDVGRISHVLANGGFDVEVRGLSEVPLSDN